jgi:DEAD/DEAH box helicase domain-containing protein
VKIPEFITHLKQQPWYRGQIVHVEHLMARPARYGRLDRPLPPALDKSLKRLGIEQLYSHQAQAINVVRNGQPVVVATGTSSGKTLCYNLPVLESILGQRGARALYLFPTKALAQDQLRSLRDLCRGDLRGIKFATYDGDTPKSARARLRKEAQILLTNPDMLHVGILPNHGLWSHFLSNLKFVVIDEAHVYRGVFGSQVACVLRRLARLCEFYGSRPQFICCSATIANPAEHVERLTGQRPVVVNQDGAPRGRKEFVLWNPPFIDVAKTARKSANTEATDIFTELVKAGLRNITFTRAQKVAELILLYTREALRKNGSDLIDRVAAYRAGYLPEQRREIERALFRGELIGVTATNALELGVDIGHLDATVLVGYPGTIASTWQQAGRSGRGVRESLSVLVGLDNPLDQYFMHRPDELFGRPHEYALIDPDNVYILERHLPCAAYELPLSNEDEARFGPGFVQAMINLENAGVLEYRHERFYYLGLDYPAEGTSIRSIAGRPVLLYDEDNDYRLLEEIDGQMALWRVHPGAIYLHQGESYLVTRLDLDAGVAYARLADVNYYTEPREVNDVRILGTVESRPVGTTTAHFGRVMVTQQVIGYRRRQQFTETMLAEEWLDLPPRVYETMAVWWDVPGTLMREIAERGLDPLGGLHAAEHAAIGLLPLFAMCDRWDIGGLSTPAHVDTGKPQIIIYDGFPGGVGITEQGYRILTVWWAATLRHLEECPCQAGCPSCVQSPKCGNLNQTLDKEAAKLVIRGLLGRSERFALRRILG